MKLSKLFFTSLLALSLTGCIKEDRSDCPLPLNITLNFQYIRQGSDLFTERIDNVHVVIYDSYGVFVTSLDVPQEELEIFQGMRLNLPPGSYRVVAWGNNSALTHLDENSTLDSAVSKHAHYASGTSENGDPLYYGQLGTLVVPATGEIQEILDFTGAHKTIEVYVKGFLETIGEVPSILPQVEVTSLAQGYDYSMQCLPEIMCYKQQSQSTTVSGSTMAMARFHAPLFENDNPIRIHVQSPSDSRIIYTVDLKQYLIDNNISLITGDYELIRILIEFNDLGVRITNPAWEDTPVTPGID